MTALVPTSRRVSPPFSPSPVGPEQRVQARKDRRNVILSESRWRKAARQRGTGFARGRWCGGVRRPCINYARLPTRMQHKNWAGLLIIIHWGHLLAYLTGPRLPCWLLLRSDRESSRCVSLVSPSRVSRVCERLPNRRASWSRWSPRVSRPPQLGGMSRPIIVIILSHALTRRGSSR